MVVPRYPDSDGPLAGPPSRIGQLQAISMLKRVAPDRVGIFDLENEAGTPIYIHAKICVVDDTWFTIGSDNFNRRSWTTDSELTCAVFDTSAGHPDSSARAGSGVGLARDLRLQLWSEHLGTDVADAALLDPAAGLDLWRASAAALDRWHASGSSGPRPAGRVRRHTPEPVSRLQRLWASPVNRLGVDPDGRPRPLRGTPDF